MVPSIGSGPATRLAWVAVIAAFFLFLFAPLLVTGVFAFNDSAFPSPPWRGFTLDWFAAGGAKGRMGALSDGELLGAIGVSLRVALAVTLLSLTVGTANAFLLERTRFPGKNLVAVAMLFPLVIPGVILGTSILSLSSQIANALDELWAIDADPLRPGLTLVVLGQFSFIVTIVTLIMAARLRKLDPALEEAAADLGASRLAAFLTVTLPFLAPALVGAAATAVLMSFENLNTTLMLVGSDRPLTILIFGRMRQGASPELNAVSLLMIAASALLAVAAALSGKEDKR